MYKIAGGIYFKIDKGKERQRVFSLVNKGHPQEHLIIDHIHQNYTNSIVINKQNREIRFYKEQEEGERLVGDGAIWIEYYNNKNGERIANLCHFKEKIHYNTEEKCYIIKIERQNLSPLFSALRKKEFITPEFTLEDIPEIEEKILKTFVRLYETVVDENSTKSFITVYETPNIIADYYMENIKICIRNEIQIKNDKFYDNIREYKIDIKKIKNLNEIIKPIIEDAIKEMIKYYNNILSSHEVLEKIESYGEMHLTKDIKEILKKTKKIIELTEEKTK